MAASDVGVKSSGTVTGWKNGAIPRQGVIKRLADYFCVSVSDLIGEQKEKPDLPKETGLSTAKQEAWDLIQKMDDETLKRFIAAAKAMLGE